MTDRPIARDEFANSCGEFSSNVWATLWPRAWSSNVPGGYEHNRTLATHVTLLAPQGSLYNRYSGTVYAAGDYQLLVAALSKGGLTATYYTPPPPSFTPASDSSAELLGAEESSLGRPFEVVTDSTVDFSTNSTVGWGGCSTLTRQVCNKVPSDFNIRWGGVMVSSAHSSAGSEAFNFSVDLAQSEQRVRLWVDNLLLIDQWSSLSGLTSASKRNVTVATAMHPPPSGPESSTAFTHGNRTSLSIRLDYAAHSSQHGITLKSSSAFTPEGAFAEATESGTNTNSPPTVQNLPLTCCPVRQAAHR